MTENEEKKLRGFIAELASMASNFRADVERPVAEVLSELPSADVPVALIGWAGAVLIQTIGAEQGRAVTVAILANVASTFILGANERELDMICKTIGGTAALVLSQLLEGRREDSTELVVVADVVAEAVDE